MLILASASPRRHDLLLASGIDHRVQPVNILERILDGEDPQSFVQRLARWKAHAVSLSPGDRALGADTIVCLGGQILGKPRGSADAARMLHLLSGRDHTVLTGICLRSEEKAIVDLAVTRVSFVSLSAAEIEDYVNSGEPTDKAGAYAIQGLASKFVSGIEGCYHNVVGLPVSLVYRYLKLL
ncbi:MAG TPA: Maf family protein [Bryobacteraceae bacterium]|jgi:septum formation protein|nr:Maf family protein [Bryobacteraceae bacterium]